MKNQSIFDKILLDGIRKGHAPARSLSARKWFREKAAGQTRVNRNKLLSESGRKRQKVAVGRMYLFKYDAKTKDKLPYWDGMPLVFIVHGYPDGFLSINLHYAPPKMRAIIMDALYNFVSDDKYDEKTKLLLSYKVLQRFVRSKEVQPCIKKHLYSQLESSLIEIHPSEWDICLFLPLAKWMGASSNRVYSDYKRKMG